ncbi:Crp/Fnr family transcriptional regulator [Coraliomargarita akajimensis]|uniref:Putative transcriptional regulator, Crp/Fnr family n=1 Tax=Coraliomargarita akajimensis (strain DSM 45221 / IAM 15411 / JCM 23193 / KCTC 12865 / 04OKA010-24) TaxID=583355 RepID=D5EPA9_CORAD|nr:cyclic nucleotide-binding domain-containing protein [Coraliomargarita akajimensis]ADE55619.1 putative transcriptional regulator, Crp/Fnr family [Coraliomargarita akajimensis DSM 45221]
MIDASCSCSDLPVREFADGDLIIAKDAQVDALYFLKEGVVSIYRDGEHLTDADEVGTVLGEICVLLGRLPLADVRAKGPVKLYVAENPEVFMRECPEMVLQMARSLAKKVDFMSAYLSDLKRQYSGQDNHLGMVHEVLDSLLNTKD